MKLNTRGNDKATVVGGKSLGTYRINANKAAFETLSSRLYSDKIRAVIRELACNAYDAHVAADKENVPFEVHLPTTFEPHFEMKDFGTGLAHIDIVDLFCTYFGTNKSDSDKFIGALGLGSKSPFCLTMRNETTGREEAQGFSITNRFKGDSGECPVCGKLVLLVDEWMRDQQRGIRFTRKPIEHEVGRISEKSAFDRVDTDEEDSHVNCEGVGLLPKHGEYEGWEAKQPLVVRMYDAMIEDGEPKLMLMAERIVPEEPLGITVKFDVQQSQIWEFENKAKVAFEFFAPRPIFNIEDFSIPQVEYSVKTALWGMRKVAATPQTNTVRAIQGKVQYSVGNIDVSRTTDWQKKLLAMPLDLFFPIGQLDPAVSRETLELNERTIKNILGMLDSVYEEMLAEIKKKIDACSQPYEARLLAWELVHSEGIGKIVNDAWNKGDLFGKYQNFVLSDKKPFLNDLDMEQTILVRFSKNGEKKRAKKEVLTKVCEKWNKQTVMSDVMAGRAKKEEYNREIDVEPKVAFLINDLKQGGDKYVHFLIQEWTEQDHKDFGLNCEKSVVYMLNRVDKFADPKEVAKEARKMLKRIGNPPFILMSELKAKLKPILDVENDNPRMSRERRTIIELNLNLGSRRHQRGKGWQEAWDKSEEQPEGIKYYIPVERLKATESGFNRSYDLVDFINTIIKTGMFGIDNTTVIYGLRKNSKLRQKAEWVDLIPHLKRMIPTVLNTDIEMRLSYLLSPFQSDHSSLLSRIADKKLLYAKSPLQKFCNQLRAAQNSQTPEQDRALHEIIRQARIWGIYHVTNTVTFDATWKELKERYPLLKLSWYGAYDANKDDRLIVDYLLMIDERDGITAPVRVQAAAASGDGIVTAPSELTVSETEVSNV